MQLQLNPFLSVLIPLNRVFRSFQIQQNRAFRSFQIQQNQVFRSFQIQQNQAFRTFQPQSSSNKIGRSAIPTPQPRPAITVIVRPRVALSNPADNFPILRSSPRTRVCHYLECC